jgi:hypothetical protein
MAIVLRTTSSYRSIKGRITISPKYSASFFSIALTSFLGLSATKNRATTSEDLIEGCCIHVFLTAMRSEKWLVAERTPMKRRKGVPGNGGAFHSEENSIAFCGEKLG